MSPSLYCNIFSGRTPSDSLEKLKQECEEIKTLVPTRTSQSSDHELELPDRDFLEDGDSVEVTPEESPLDSPIKMPQNGSSHVMTQNAGLSLEGLDLLPTKEEPRVFSEQDFAELGKNYPKFPTITTKISSSFLMINISNTS